MSLWKNRIVTGSTVKLVSHIWAITKVKLQSKQKKLEKTDSQDIIIIIIIIINILIVNTLLIKKKKKANRFCIKIY